ncbi:hypothetical protein AA313_de0202437 [Arthrobotrys entomopaga]|nr:hypothetical protein AA313_de0202437 [Arthrobotrys entomopaga]
MAARGEKCGPEGYTCLDTGVANLCGNWLGYKDYCCSIGLQGTNPAQVITVPCSYIPSLSLGDIKDAGFPAYNETGAGCPNDDHPIDFFRDVNGGTTECCRTLDQVVVSDISGNAAVIGCGDWTGINPSAQDITNGGGTVPSGGAGTPASAANGGSGSSPTSAGSNSSPSQTSGSGNSPSQTSGTSTNSGGGNGGSTTTTTPASKSTPAAASSNFQKVTSLVLGTAAFVIFLGAQL